MAENILNILVSGGVPLLFAAFGVFLLYLWITSPISNDLYFAIGLASAGLGAWLFYVKSKS